MLKVVRAGYHDGIARTSHAERSGSFRSIDSASLVHRASTVQAFPDKNPTLQATQPCTVSGCDDGYSRRGLSLGSAERAGKDGVRVNGTRLFILGRTAVPY